MFGEEKKDFNDFPSFHKKNISKKKLIEEAKIEAKKEDKMDYPIKYLSWHSKDNYYPELDPAVEFYNQKRYKTALELFESRPPDPARFFKNLVCTFHGPIGWLLMANTKSAKDRFLNFCIASCHYRLKNYSKALQYIEGNETEQALYLRAWCQYKLNKDDQARETFKEVFYKNPKLLSYRNPYKEDYR